jgi:hypothetical protein
VELFDFGGGEGAVEEGEFVEGADVGEAHVDAGFVDVPSEGLLARGEGAAGFAVEVELRGAVGLAGVVVGEGPDDVGPFGALEGRAFDFDEGFFGEGNGVPIAACGVPDFFVGVGAEAEFARLFVFGEFDEEGGVVPLFGGDLDGVGVAGFEVFVGGEAQPDGNGSGPVVGGVGGVAVGFEVHGFGGLFVEAQAVAEFAFGVAGDGGAGGEAGEAGLFHVGRVVELFVAEREVGVLGLVEGGVEGDGGFKVGGDGGLGGEEREGEGGLERVHVGECRDWFWKAKQRYPPTPLLSGNFQISVTVKGELSCLLSVCCAIGGGVA